MPCRKLLVVAQDAAMPSCAVLFEAYAGEGVSVEHLSYRDAPPGDSELRDAAAAHDAVLFIGPGKRAPRTALSGPLLPVSGERLIPIGWMPFRSPVGLGNWAAAAARVHRRSRDALSLALLGQRHPRYLHLTDRMEAILRKAGPDFTVFRWTSDLLLREDMIRGLRCGIGAAVYLGHGRPIGWVGYYGLRTHHFEAEAGEPLGALISLCCLTASRRRTGLSFAESLPLRGVAASAFGAVKETLHTDNTRWALGIGEALLKGAATIGELIAEACPQKQSARDAYRLIGDPVAPLYSPQDGRLAAERIAVYP